MLWRKGWQYVTNILNDSNLTSSTRIIKPVLYRSHKNWFQFLMRSLLFLFLSHSIFYDLSRSAWFQQPNRLFRPRRGVRLLKYRLCHFLSRFTRRLFFLLHFNGARHVPSVLVSRSFTLNEVLEVLVRFLLATAVNGLRHEERNREYVKREDGEDVHEWVAGVGIPCHRRVTQWRGCHVAGRVRTRV